MRVLVVGHKSWFGAWTESTTSALKTMGHTVHVFHYEDQTYSFKTRLIAQLSHLSRSVPKILSKLNRVHERLLETVQKFKPDLVLVLKGDVLTKKTLEAIKHQKTILVVWWVDDPLLFPDAIETFSCYDAFFVFDSDLIPRLRELPIPYVDFLPNAYATDVFYPQQLTSREVELYKCDVAFVGSYYPPREEMFKALKNRNVAIWGPGSWEKQPTLKKYLNIDQAFRGRVLPVTEAAKLYSGATICLNHHHHQITGNGLNLRAYEIPACGGFELVDYRPGFDALLAGNQEVVYYHSFDEIGSLVEYYLSHPDERHDIARQGYERVIKEHSYQHRIEKIILLLKAKGHPLAESQ
ncbi:MAG: glycosyltransferase [Anaerolineae bacterium]